MPTKAPNAHVGRRLKPQQPSRRAYHKSKIPKSYLPCRHCKRRKYSKSRGLCFKCHSDLSIRESYSCVNPRKDTPGRWMNPNPKLGKPTLARPGSAEKLCVFEERVKLGLSLFHPEDARGEDDNLGGDSRDSQLEAALAEHLPFLSLVEEEEVEETDG